MQCARTLTFGHMMYSSGERSLPNLNSVKELTYLCILYIRNDVHFSPLHFSASYTWSNKCLCLKKTNTPDVGQIRLFLRRSMTKIKTKLRQSGRVTLPGIETRTDGLSQEVKKRPLQEAAILSVHKSVSASPGTQRPSLVRQWTPSYTNEESANVFTCCTPCWSEGTMEWLPEQLIELAVCWNGGARTIS